MTKRLLYIYRAIVVKQTVKMVDPIIRTKRSDRHLTQDNTVLSVTGDNEV